jgi:hypothetical protein
MNAQIHRYGDKVAVHLPNSPTSFAKFIYLSQEDAIRLYIAISECAESIRKQPDFSKSTFETQLIPLESIDKN